MSQFHLKKSRRLIQKMLSNGTMQRVLLKEIANSNSSTLKTMKEERLSGIQVRTCLARQWNSSSECISAMVHPLQKVSSMMLTLVKATNSLKPTTKTLKRQHKKSCNKNKHSRDSFLRKKMRLSSSRRILSRFRLSRER